MKNLYSQNTYKKVYVDIIPIMEKQNMTRNRLAEEVKTKFEVINRWCGGSMEKIDMDILARICHVLECEPGDILKLSDETSELLF